MHACKRDQSSGSLVGGGGDACLFYLQQGVETPKLTIEVGKYMQN